MSKICVVSAEGVLCRKDRKENPFRANQPLPDGMTLVSALSTAYRIAVASAETEGDEIAGWLRDHGMGPFFSYVLPHRVGMPETRPERIMAQVEHMRSCGFSIGMVLDTDPATVNLLLAKGYNALTFTHPEYARPEWRPDDPRGGRAWAEIENEVEQQARLKAEDGRIGNEADGRYETV